jgi:hypothetical protein
MVIATQCLTSSYQELCNLDARSAIPPEGSFYRFAGVGEIAVLYGLDLLHALINLFI